MCTGVDVNFKSWVLSMSNALKGLDELTAKLVKMDAKLAKKTLRTAMMYATTPTVKDIKAAAPRGTKAHRLHNGRLVAPGHLSRSIKRSGRVGKKGYELRIGVSNDAFYGVSFLEKGITVTARKGKKIKPYTIKGREWFKSNFEQNEKKMVSRFRDKLAQRVEEAMR